MWPGIVVNREAWATADCPTPSYTVWLKLLLVQIHLLYICITVQNQWSRLTNHSSALKLLSSDSFLLRSVGISASIPHCTNREGRRFLPKDRQTWEQSLYIWTDARHWGRIRSLSAISISLLLSARQHQHKDSSLLDHAAGSADTECREREGTVGTRKREKVAQCD